MQDQFLAVLRRAFTLEEDAWVELRDNASFTGICGGLAAAVALLGGLGAWLWGVFNLTSTPDGFFVDTVILGTIFTLLLLAGWFVITYVILVQVFRVTIALDALIRVFAVAIVPLALGFLVFIPELNFWIALSSIAFTLGLLAFALRAAFSVTRMQAIQATLAGFAVFAIVLSLLITANDIFATGAFVFEATEDGVTRR
jgi:hypothetical protein